ncbi:MAG: hypothetical protein A2Y33_02075 [Spirochaetes bacterium GWF1_51_8]|nr:MAG: hypothetical protein A2Y33_02075 [Spirochaetes bacterium GWF1_51_8]
MRKSVLSLFIMISAGILLYSGCGDQGTVKTGPVQYVIESFSGDVKVSHNDGKDWMAAESDMMLSENDIVKTGAKSYVDIIMPDRGIFRVSYDTEIVLKKLSGGVESIGVNKGKVAINVINKLNEKETFKVESESSVALVRGTEFVVSVDDDGSVVAVKDGTVNMVENIEITVADPALKAQIEAKLQVPVSSMEQAKMNKADSQKMEVALNTAIKEAKNDEEVLKAVEDVREEYEVEKTPADQEVLDTEFSEINKPEKLKKVNGPSKADKDALEELGKDVGMGKTGDKVGPNATTIEEDIKNQEVEKLMDKVGTNSGGMGKDGKKVIGEKVGDKTSTIQEDIENDEAGKLLEKKKQDSKKSDTEPAPTDNKKPGPGGKGKSMLDSLK